MRFSEKLASLRKKRGFSQAYVAAYLTEHGTPLTQKGISKWECGDTTPSAEQFLLLCRLYEVRDVLAVFCALQGEEACLNEKGREKVKEYIRLLHLDWQFIRQDTESLEESIDLIDLDKTVIQAEQDPQKLIKTAEMPNNADLAIRLGDESMAPLYEKGQIVLIHKQKTVDPGDFGFFSYEDVYYCRLLMEQEDTELLAVNADYAPIIVQNKEKLKTIGRVLT